MGRVISIFMLTLIFLSLFVFASNIQPVKSSGTIYIRADGSIDPPTASIERVGDTYRFTTDIYASIVIERGDLILDGANFNLQGTGTGVGVTVQRDLNDVVITNITIQNFQEGVLLRRTVNSNISSSNMIENQVGVYAKDSSSTIIMNNNLTNNLQKGLHLSNSSSGTIRRNNMTDNGWSVTLESCSDYNTIEMNKIRGGYACVILNGSCHNSILKNNLTSSQIGVLLYQWSDYNNIITNNITNHLSSGVDFLCESSENTFYHNNFMSNALQVNFDSTTPNIWHNGYPSGGNYWSDYEGVDQKSGPNQDQPGSDGIGDAAYIIDSDNVDCYPLMMPFYVGDLALIGVKPIQVILDQKALIANKSTAVQVDVFSTFFDDKRVLINLTYNFGTEPYSETGISGEGVEIKPGLNRIYIPGGPIYRMQDEEWVASEPWNPPEGDDFFLKWKSAGTDNNIRVLIDPNNLIAETDETNNKLFISKDIVESKSLRILVVPVYFPDIGQHPKPPPKSISKQMDFLLGTYPVADDKLFWTVNPPISFSGSCPSPDHETQFAIWLYLKVGIPVTDMARNLGYDRAVIVIHDLSPSWSGLAPGMTFTGLDNRIPVFVVETYIDSTSPLFDESLIAHEIGHTFYLHHPHDLGPPVYDAWRFWPARARVEESMYQEYSSTFMSYASQLPWGIPSSPKWVDEGRFEDDSATLIPVFVGPFTIFVLRSNLFDQLTSSQTKTLELEESQGTIAISFLLFENKTALIDRPWYRLAEGAPDLDFGSVGNYSIAMLDDEGQMITRFGFNATFIIMQEVNETLIPTEADMVPFALNIPYVTGTRFVEIRNSTDHILASRVLTTNTPSVNVTFPNGGETLVAGVVYNVSWNGADYDGDALTFTLAYSPDFGKNWIPLAIELNQSSYLWDTSNINPGASYLVKVIASDWVNTCADISNGTFTVLDLTPPEINIISPENKTYYSDLVLLTYNISEESSWIGYSLNNQSNATITGNITLLDMPYGAYNITVYANDTYGNMGLSSVVCFMITIPGDINSDQYVNAKDAIALGVAFYPSGEYNPNADINGDGYCNAKDAVILGSHFNKHWE